MWEGREVLKSIEIKQFFSSFERICDSKFSFYGEAHNFWEILFVIKGNVIVSADERVYSLASGDIIFHKPMEFHKFHGNGNDDFHIFVMSFECDSDSMKSLENRVFSLTDEQKNYLETLIYFIRKCVNDEISEDGYIQAIEENVHYMQMFSNMSEIFLISCVSDLKEVAPELKTYKTQIYKSAVNLMEKNVTNNITTSEIARKCNVSVSYLKKIFSEYAGMGIHKFFLTLKMGYACKLLKQGATVSEVAEILSFSTQNYFSLVFKREIGIAPTEYKKRENQ